MWSVLRSRIHVGAWAVFIILVILLLMNQLSTAIFLTAHVPLHSSLFFYVEMSGQVWSMIKPIILVPIVLFWAMDRRRWLEISVLMSNLLLTLQLLASTLLLVLTLETDIPSLDYLLIVDTLLVMVINILIFSLWYWIIDSPVLRQGTMRESEPWDFLFPQRASKIAGYADWSPNFPDYIFLAFATTFTIGTTDTMPLSQRAKALMLLQAAISVATIVVLAGRALTILD
jgi:hypothetical protein